MIQTRQEMTPMQKPALDNTPQSTNALKWTLKNILRPHDQCILLSVGFLELVLGDIVEVAAGEFAAAPNFFPSTHPCVKIQPFLSSCLKNLFFLFITDSVDPDLQRRAQEESMSVVENAEAIVEEYGKMYEQTEVHSSCSPKDNIS